MPLQACFERVQAQKEQLSKMSELLHKHAKLLEAGYDTAFL